MTETLEQRWARIGHKHQPLGGLAYPEEPECAVCHQRDTEDSGFGWYYVIAYERIWWHNPQMMEGDWAAFIICEDCYRAMTPVLLAKREIMQDES